MRTIHRLLADGRGASAAEFALILPVLILFLLGIIDISMWMWTENRAEKATQAAVRHAAVTQYVAGGLDTISFAGRTVNGQVLYSGDRIPANAVPPITCRSSGCTPGSVLGTSITLNAAAFAAVVQGVRGLLPEAQASNVVVRYQHVGLGYAGDPNGSDIAPLVTVEIEDMAGRPLFNPIFLDLFVPNGFRLTGIESSMTMEDGIGTASFSS